MLRFTSRYSASRAAERSAKQQAKQREAEVDRRTVVQFGGDQLTILSFAVDSTQVARGSRVLMCYGVSNATKLRIEPDVEPVKPFIRVS